MRMDGAGNVIIDLQSAQTDFMNANRLKFVLVRNCIRLKWRDVFVFSFAMVEDVQKKLQLIFA